MTDESTTTPTVDPGTRLWTFESGGELAFGPAVGNGVVVLTDGENTVYALDASSGESLWDINVGGASTPVIAGDTLYVPGGNTVVATAAADTTQEKWRHESDGMPFRGIIEVGDSVFTMRWRNRGSTRVLSHLARDDGSVRWTKETRLETGYITAATQDTVYTAHHDGRLVALSVSDGSRQWSFSVDGGVIGAFVDSGTVYVGAGGRMDGGTIHALNSADGSEKWAIEHGGPAATPIVDDERLYVGGAGIQVFDRGNQSKLWGFDAGLTRLSLNDGRVYANVEGEEIRVYDAASGDRGWSTAFDEELQGAPVASNDVVYVVDRSGVLHAVADGELSARTPASTSTATATPTPGGTSTTTVTPTPTPATTTRSDAQSSYFHDGFEEGLDAWTVVEDSWQRTNQRAYRGSYSSVIDAGNDIRTISTKTFSEAKQLSGFGYAWFEEAGSYGGGIRLLNDRDEVELAFATDNPEWMVGNADSVAKVHGGVDYRTWVHTGASFDWSNGTAEVEFSHPSSGKSYSGAHSLAHGRNIETIELRAFTSKRGWVNDSCQMSWDEIIAQL